MHVNYPVRQLFYVGALPVPLQTLRQQRVEHTLYRGEGHGSDPVEDWDRKLAADWLDSLLTILGRPVVAGDPGNDLLAPDVLWERLGRGHRLEAQESAKLQRRLRQEVAIPLHDLPCVLDLPEHRAGKHHGYRVCPKHEARHDAEVAPAATQAPEQVLVLAAARRYRAAVRQHHVGLDQVVDCEAAFASQVPRAASQG